MIEYFDFVDEKKWERNSGEWLEALRSGKYLQTTDSLKTSVNFQTAETSYCCLGLACEIADIEQDEAFRFGKTREDGLPPEEFARWLGFDPDSVVINPSWDGMETGVSVYLNNPRSVVKGYKDSYGRWNHLEKGQDIAAMNDMGASFEQIAKLIEKYGIKMTWSANVPYTD